MSSIKEFLLCFFLGIIFALGLGFGGMLDPQNIFDFLDFFGSFNPSLMIVMGSAVPVYFLFFQIMRGKKSIFSNQVIGKPDLKIDRNLIAGAILFGAGWGLCGFCPAPGIVSLVSLGLSPLVFVISMVLGMHAAGRIVK
jgi:uncharacterized membrane protein YedE/YeeE